MVVLSRRVYCCLIAIFVATFLAVLIAAIVEKILSSMRSHDGEGLSKNGFFTNCCSICRHTIPFRYTTNSAIREGEKSGEMMVCDIDTADPLLLFLYGRRRMFARTVGGRGGRGAGGGWEMHIHSHINDRAELAPLFSGTQTNVQQQPRGKAEKL